jgi:hypothetical protein
MPFFRRHSRIAAKRAEPRPTPGVEVLEPVDEVPVEEAPVEAALVLEDVVLDEPPHAARPIQASNRINMAAAAGLRLLVLVWGMELLCR